MRMMMQMNIVMMILVFLSYTPAYIAHFGNLVCHKTCTKDARTSLLHLPTADAGRALRRRLGLHAAHICACCWQTRLLAEPSDVDVLHSVTERNNGPPRFCGRRARQPAPVT